MSNEIDQLELRALRNFAKRIKRLVDESDDLRAAAFLRKVRAEVASYTSDQAGFAVLHAIPGDEPEQLEPEPHMTVADMVRNLRRATALPPGHDHD